MTALNWKNIDFEVDPHTLMLVSAEVSRDGKNPEPGHKVEWNREGSGVQVYCDQDHGSWVGALSWDPDRKSWRLDFGSGMRPSWPYLLADADALARREKHSLDTAERLNQFRGRLTGSNPVQGVLLRSST